MLRDVLISTTAVLTLASATMAPARADDGEAIVAGIIGGLALGGLAAAAAHPAYGYPVYEEQPAYPRVVSHCWREPRQVLDTYGNAYSQSVKVCR